MPLLSPGQTEEVIIFEADKGRHDLTGMRGSALFGAQISAGFVEVAGNGGSPHGW